MTDAHFPYLPNGAGLSPTPNLLPTQLIPQPRQNARQYFYWGRFSVESLRLWRIVQGQDTSLWHWESRFES